MKVQALRHTQVLPYQLHDLFPFFEKPEHLALGALAHPLFVKRQVRGIFEYRTKVLGGALAKVMPWNVA